MAIIQRIIENVGQVFEPTPIGPKKLTNADVSTKLFLKSWARRDPTVSQHLTDDVKKQLKITIRPDEKQKYFRAFKFRTEQEVERAFETPFEQLSRGTRVIFTTQAITTWGKSPQEVADYHNVNYDNFSRKEYGIDDYNRLGIGDKQPIGFSVLVMSMVPYNDVLVDLSLVPRKYLTPSANGDILVLPGTYVGAIVSTNTAQADVQRLTDERDKKTQELQNRDETIKTELEQLSKTEKVVQQLVRKSGIKPKEISDAALIKFISQFDDQAMAAGVILAYGDQFPAVYDWIEQHKQQFVNTPWKYISLSQVLQTKRQKQ